MGLLNFANIRGGPSNPCGNDPCGNAYKCAAMWRQVGGIITTPLVSGFNNMLAYVNACDISTIPLGQFLLYNFTNPSSTIPSSSDPLRGIYESEGSHSTVFSQIAPDYSGFVLRAQLTLPGEYNYMLLGVGPVGASYFGAPQYGPILVGCISSSPASVIDIGAWADGKSDSTFGPWSSYIALVGPTNTNPKDGFPNSFPDIPTFGAWLVSEGFASGFDPAYAGGICAGTMPEYP